MTTKNHGLTEEQQNFVMENYQKIAGRELSRMFGIGYNKIICFLRQKGLKRSSRRGTHSLNDFYFNDESKFTSATWFLIGFLIGDGNIASPNNNHKTPQKLNMSLHTKDKEILELLKRELEATCEIKDRIRHDKRTDKDYYISEFYCNSIQLCSDLAKYGIVPQKTGKEFLPDIPNEFFYDFLAGIFSADGCISKSNNSFRFDICCPTEQFLIDIQTKLGCGKIRFQQQNIYRLVINQTDLVSIAEKLVKSKEILSRKKELLIEFLSTRKV